MKKNKGFTLVELLAVIVILAIVALVVVPVVMGVIKDARKKAAIESFRGYMDAVEKTIIRDSMKTTSELPNKDSNGCYSLRELDSKVKVKGDHPEIENEDKLCVENGKITSVSEVEMNGYALEYKDGDILLNGQAIEDKTIPEITIGEVTATTNSITIPYEVQSGKSGVTVTCEYGTSESYGNQGTIEDNKCILSNLEEDTKYYFRINSKTGKNKTANQASSATTKTLCDYTVNQQFNFSYTGNVQTFSPKCTGKYKLEVWGAQGGSAPAGNVGGYGGYSYGNINLNRSTQVYVYVGGQGSGSYYQSINGGWNGGGNLTSYHSSQSTYGNSSGGGGTDIRINSSSLYARVIVAGGGGGTGWDGSCSTSYCHGGGYIGNNAVPYSSGAPNSGGNQTSGGNAVDTQGCSSHFVNGKGQFGIGITGYWDHASFGGSAGGGGGWYGGGNSSSCNAVSGGGGSGYIYNSASASSYPSGCLLNSDYYLTDAGMYCYYCSSSSATATKTTSTSNVSSSAVSNYAKQGNGYARITYLGK